MNLSVGNVDAGSVVCSLSVVDVSVVNITGTVKQEKTQTRTPPLMTVLLVAGVAMSAAHLTGNHMWDACGSLAVSCLLGATAVFLIQQNRSLLLGNPINSLSLPKMCLPQPNASLQKMFCMSVCPHPHAAHPQWRYVKVTTSFPGVFLIRLKPLSVFIFVAFPDDKVGQAF